MRNRAGQTIVPFILTDGAVADKDNRERSVPTKAHATDAAYDLKSAEDFTVFAGRCRIVNTGIAIAIPDGHAGLILSRSGLAFNRYVAVLNSPGLIDPGYQGDVGVLLFNHSDIDYTGKPGDRIAQLLIVKTAEVELSHAAWLPSGSNRGTGGFGSTGV